MFHIFLGTINVYIIPPRAAATAAALPKLLTIVDTAEHHSNVKAQVNHLMSVPWLKYVKTKVSIWEEYGITWDNIGYNQFFSMVI